MAALGAAKHFAVDVPKEERDTKKAANRTRWSGWTGLKPDPVKDADLLGTVAQFGLTGAQLGQNMNTANAQNALTEQQTRWLASGHSPYGNFATHPGLNGRLMMGPQDPRFQSGWSSLRQDPVSI